MKNLNPYNQSEFQDKFRQTQIFSMLVQKYDNICFEKFFETHHFYPTPRHIYAGGYPTNVSAVPFYYLQYLDQSVQMVDLGCGMNFFKPYFLNLKGISPDTKMLYMADENDIVDDDFFKNHVGVYQSVFSINALHFHPMENLRDICLKFSAMLAPGGRGFLALNLQRMIDRSSSNHNLSQQELDNWVRKQFENFPCKILVFDVDLSVLDAFMDGNIRIVFEK
jgi:hypothetical protein